MCFWTDWRQLKNAIWTKERTCHIIHRTSSMYPCILPNTCCKLYIYIYIYGEGWISLAPYIIHTSYIIHHTSYIYPCIHASMHPSIRASVHPCNSCISASVFPCFRVSMQPRCQTIVHPYIDIAITGEAGSALRPEDV